MSIISIKNLKKNYGSHTVLENINLDIKENDFLMITGASGCGKSTLLNIIGMLDNYNEGTIKLYNDPLPKPFSKKAEILLKNKIGYLFQNFALIENESVQYNLEIVLDKRKKEKKRLIKEALELVGLNDYESKMIYECSGGEQQRIALARLLIKPCEIILADEPTGSLDPNTKEQIIQILLELNKKGKTIIMVTHDNDLLKYATQIYQLD